MKNLDQLSPWLSLNLTPGVGSVLFRRLVNHFGSPESVLGASEAQLTEVVGVSQKISRSIIQTAGGAIDDLVEREIEDVQVNDVRVICWDDEEYPQSLREIHDPPCLFYLRGTLLPQDEYAVAIVGTRRISAYGREMSRRIASDLAREGITIVSGFAVIEPYQ